MQDAETALTWGINMGSMDDASINPPEVIAAVVAAIAEELHLPAIEGVSGKQIAYAESLRHKFVAQHSGLVKDAVNMRDSADQQAMLAAKAAEAGMETDAFIRATLRKKATVDAQYQAYIVATVGAARELIDTLRGDY